MKPSLSVQTVSSVPSHLVLTSQRYPFLQRLSLLVSGDTEVSTDTSLHTFLRLNTTIDRLFSSPVLRLFQEPTVFGSVLLRSLATYSPLSAIACSIDATGHMLLTLSRSLDQATGLDASQEIIDSAHHDASTRLLAFNLVQLASTPARLERIRVNSRVLARKEHAVELVMAVETAHMAEIIDTLRSGDIVALRDESLRPRLVMKQLVDVAWPSLATPPVEDEYAVLEVFEWIGRALKTTPSGELMALRRPFLATEEQIVLPHATFMSIEGPILPPSVWTSIAALVEAHPRLVLAGRVCKTLPPDATLNAQRAKHHRPRRCDPTVATADQSAFALWLTGGTGLSFRINTTA